MLSEQAHIGVKSALTLLDQLQGTKQAKHTVSMGKVGKYDTPKSSLIPGVKVVRHSERTGCCR
jgi:hypothetical protein